MRGTIELPPLGARTSDLLRTAVELAAAVTGRTMAGVWVDGADGLRQLAEVGLPAAGGVHVTSLYDAVLDAGASGLDLADARSDPRLAVAPYVVGSDAVRACAGVPVMSSDGTVVGMLAVLDSAPGRLTDESRRGLAVVAQSMGRLLTTGRESRGQALPTTEQLGEWFDERCAVLPDGHPRAVFCLQLINLDTVSAALGPTATEQLMRLIDAAFATAARPDLVVGHLRDTHFGGVALMDPGAHPWPLRERLEAIATYLIEAVRGPYRLLDLQIEIQLHVGVVATGVRGLGFVELLRQAEVARDRSPRHVNVVDELLVAKDRTDARNLATLSDLHDAVAGGQLELHYQPLSRLQPAPATGQAEPQAVEALLRWRHPSRGLLPPGDFIPLIADSVLMVDLTHWAMHEALRQHGRWRAAGLDVRVAVNVSPQVLLDHDVVAMLRSALAESRAAADRLKVEITESAIVDDADRAREIIAAIRRLGVQVALDDFGTGYTSLRLLRDFAVDEIKLDRLFVAQATARVVDGAIAEVVGRLGRALGLRTVAEGVEDVETRDLFVRLGYDYMQGYLDSRPLPAAEVEPWLRAHRLDGPDHRGPPA